MGGNVAPRGVVPSGMDLRWIPSLTLALIVGCLPPWPYGVPDAGRIETLAVNGEVRSDAGDVRGGDSAETGSPGQSDVAYLGDDQSSEGRADRDEATDSAGDAPRDLDAGAASGGRDGSTAGDATQRDPCYLGNPCMAELVTDSGVCSYVEVPDPGPCCSIDARWVCDATASAIPAPVTSSPCGLPCIPLNNCRPATCVHYPGWSRWDCQSGVREGSCDDGNPCTVGDSCISGGCVGGPSICDGGY